MIRPSALHGAALAMLLLAVFHAASPARAEPAAPQPYVRFAVRVDAPAPLAELIAADLDLARWQDYRTMTPELLERLVAEARAEVGEILAAQGYFRPRITADVTPREGLHQVRLAVDPGEATRVAQVSIEFSGSIAAGDGEDARLMQAVRRAWPLAPGAVFRQTDWARAKERAIERVAARRYAGARVVASEARVDPERGRAELSLTIDSGPPIRFGALEIFGLERYDAARVRNLWTFAPGTTYDRERLERYQRRLALLPYFANAYVDADATRIDGGEIPVRVSVAEAPSKGFDVGLGYNTDVGPGASFGYRDHNLFGRAWRLRTRIELRQPAQLGEAIVDLPERGDGWADQLGTRLRYAEVENLRTDEWVLNWRRGAIEERRQPHYGLTWVHSRQDATQVLDESVHALYAHAGYTWRTTDRLLDPRRGLVAQLEGGIAPKAVSSRGFARAVTRLAAYVPLGRRLDLALQAQGGAVLAPSSAGIPQYFLFRTGGSTTVRGYDLDSLGVRRDVAVLGGRYYALASVEATRWFDEQLGAALFVDAGNAAEHLRDLRAVWGVGVGLRARTPLGPLRVDLAYGEAGRAFRLHFSIGVTF